MRPSLPAAWLLTLGALLTGCAGGAPEAPAAQPRTTSSPTPDPTSDPTPEPLDPRSPEALGAELDFASVATTTPAQATAVAAYEDFIRSFAVAQALPDAAYPPLLEAMGPDLTVQTWDVPDAAHTGGLSEGPDGWEQRVVGFLEEQLL